MSNLKRTSFKNFLLIAGIVLLTILSFISCTDDEVAGNNNDEHPASLAITNLKAIDIDIKKAPTRAVASSDYPTSKFIGFFVKADAANGYTASNNRKGGYDLTRKLWLPDAPTPADSIWLNNHDADITVYAPYDVTHTTAATLNLAACLRPADGSKDIWCKRFTANNRSKGLAVTLEHLYARLVINLSLDANYKGTAPIDSVTLTNDSLYTIGAYKPFEETTYIYTGDAGIEFKLPSVVNLTTSAPTGSIDLLLIPATLTGDIKLSLTVNKITFGVTLSKTSFASKLEAGKQYNANIKLKPTALEVTTVTINDWNDETVNGDKEPAFIEGIDIGLNFNIANGNLIATLQTDGTYKYTFADEQGYYIGQGSKVEFFSWNTLEPAGNIEQSAWMDTRDPCSKVEEGNWRTPTKEDFDALKAKGYKWGTYTMKDGTIKYGMYFGTTEAPQPEEQDNYVFFTTAGCRTSDTYYRGEGPGGYGNYWSSTINTGNNTWAYYLYTSSSRCILYGDGRIAVGHSIRCVHDK